MLSQRSGSNSPGSRSVVLCGDLNVYARTDDVMKLLAGDGVSASSYQWIAGRNIGRRPTRERRCTATVSRAQTCENPALEGSEPQAQPRDTSRPLPGHFPDTACLDSS